MTERGWQGILTVLREARGYFVLREENGEEFVVLSKEEFDKWQVDGEVQLSLADAPQEVEEEKAGDVLERINREIAMYQLRQQEEEEVDEVERETAEQLERGARVRFEPLKGDLPPDLQE